MAEGAGPRGWKCSGWFAPASWAQAVGTVVVARVIAFLSRVAAALGCRKAGRLCEGPRGL